MNSFIEFVEDRGVSNVDDLMANIEKFLENPELFFKLTMAERTALESRMDEALSVL